MGLPKIIDNERQSLLSTFIDLAPRYDHLSVATGYWDIEGMKLILGSISNYKKIRILIGREPLLKRDNASGIERPEPDYPDQDFFSDLERIAPSPELTAVVVRMKELIDQGIIEVRVYRRSFLHAKCYIFGSYESAEAVGIIGSSNFTRNGFTTNTELNALESDHRVVTFTPKNETQETGHLYWFDQKWNDELTEEWTGQFLELVRQSPVGDLTPSPYEMYIKTLLFLYADELAGNIELSPDVEKVLYAFQQRNAQLLINKLEKHGLAMLSDSVGLGKTITGGAVIKHYIQKGCRRVNIIVPKRLESQWREELGAHHGLVSGFELISMQNPDSIDKARDIDKYAPVDLFVIDEAHNLRNSSSKRHLQILSWLAANPNSKVLLLTATPINNQLEDFVNQIQLAAKGKLTSFPVVFKTSKKSEVIDFYDAVGRLSTEIKQAEKVGEEPDWNRIHSVMRQGLRQFLVRSTRNGIEKEFGGLLGSDGVLRTFPKSEVIPTPYQYTDERDSIVYELLKQKADCFSGQLVTNLDHDRFLEVTQRTQHPLDILSADTTLFKENEGVPDTFVSLFRSLLTLGFIPYRTETYKHQFYAKDIDVIKSYDLKEKESFKLMSALSIHNMLRVSLLKRLESSPYALRRSLEAYSAKIKLFSEWLEKGYILTFKQIDEIVRDQGDDVELDANSELGEHIAADANVFNVDAIKRDLARDQKIIKALLEVCKELEKNDDKLQAFVELLQTLRNENKNGGKVLLFSFYADTITYLSAKLPAILGEDFSKKAAFLSGANIKEIDVLTRRFAPVAKKHQVDPNEELQFLFATDVLSEGQNLQDCGVIVNFDLHWNPVRMIQRNGRINRLGSPHDKVSIYNLNPAAQLEAYLKLVHRLESKVKKINFAIGNDQSVLGEKENPIEYVENLYTENATEYAKTLEDDEVFLSEDEYVNDLRKFMKEATPEQLHFLERIPSGKWGYLPLASKSNSDCPNILSLVHVTTANETTYADADIFVASTGDISDPVETLEALAHLRTTKAESERSIDSIYTDKNRVRRLVEAQASNEAMTASTPVRLRPSQASVLDVLALVLPGFQFQTIIQNIMTVQDKKKWDKLFTEAYKNIKEHGQLMPQTINALKLAYETQGRDTTPTEDLVIDSVNATLFYAK
jgi:superfamily II DNA or RNA helicase